MSSLNFKTCTICRKPFTSYGGSICGNCLEEIDLSFVKIRDFLYDHPERIGIEKLAEFTEVPEEIILLLISQGRIIVDGYEANKCDSCSRPVPLGMKLCDECKASLSKQFADSVPKPSEPEIKLPLPTKKDARMHIDRREKK